MLFDNTDFNYEISLFEIPGSDFNKEQREEQFFTPEEGFLRGNLMPSAFVPFKGLTYFKLKPENERESLLFKLTAYSFAVNDLNLYLDLHPEDTYAYSLFRKYAEEERNLDKLYASKYGPICLSDTGSTYNWIQNPWPWDKVGGTKYV